MMDKEFCENDDSSTPNCVKISSLDTAIKTETVIDLDEFEQILNKYTEQQENSDINFEITHLNSTSESINTETIIELGIEIAETAQNSNICKNNTAVDINSIEDYTKFAEKSDVNENLTINNTQDNIIKEQVLQTIKTDIDTITLSSKEGIINENDENFNLDVINDIFALNNENKSIEIEINVKNEITDESIINNSFLETDFAEAGPSELKCTNFGKENFVLGNSNINDVNTIIDLTESDTEKDVRTAENAEKINNEILLISDDDSVCSFHSSDFELISENEAKMDGLIINFKQKHENDDEITNNITNDNDKVIDMCLPGPSDDYAYRENHRVPDGEEFYNMFHGIYAPANIPDLIFLENKSVVPSQCMNVENDDFGFDLAALNREVVDEEYQNEAKETARKILSYCHGENDRRLCRRRPL